MARHSPVRVFAPGAERTRYDGYVLVPGIALNAGKQVADFCLRALQHLRKMPPIVKQNAGDVVHAVENAGLHHHLLQYCPTQWGCGSADVYQLVEHSSLCATGFR